MSTTIIKKHTHYRKKPQMIFLKMTCSFEQIQDAIPIQIVIIITVLTAKRIIVIMEDAIVEVRCVCYEICHGTFLNNSETISL